MTTTTFASGTTITSSWLNDVNTLTYTGFPAHLVDPADAHAATAIGYLQAGTGATARTTNAKLNDFLSIKDFGAIGDGVANDAAACALANTAAAAGGVVYPAGVYYINTNTTLTSPITMLPGARFKVAAGMVLTVNAPVYAGSRQYIFECSSAGVVGTFGRTEIWADWFGAAPDSSLSATPTGTDSGIGTNKAIVAIRNGTWIQGVVLFNPGTYLIETGITTVASGITLQGAGKYHTILTCKTTFTGIVVTLAGTGGPPTQFRGFGVIAATGGAAADGVIINANGSFVSDVWVSGFGIGVKLASTDQFLRDFVIEYCTTGVYVTSAYVSVANGETYISGTTGVLVSGVAESVSGQIIISDVRSSNDTATGFGVVNSANVTLSNCSASHSTNTALTVAGFSVTGTSVNVTLNSCTANLEVLSTTGIGFNITSADAVLLDNCSAKKFNKGIYISTASNVSVSGGYFKNNGLYGIHAADYNFLSINGATCVYQGGAGVVDAGILVAASRAASRVLITGNQCSTTGGGAQDYGIHVTCTSATGYGLVANNICTLNSVGQVTIDGANAANITSANNIVV